MTGMAEKLNFSVRTTERDWAFLKNAGLIVQLYNYQNIYKKITVSSHSIP